MSTKESKKNCSGQYLALWRFVYSFDVYGDGEKKGTVVRQFDVVAVTEGLAAESFKVSLPSPIYTLQNGPEFICYVDSIVTY